MFDNTASFEDVKLTVALGYSVGIFTTKSSLISSGSPFLISATTSAISLSGTVVACVGVVVGLVTGGAKKLHPLKIKLQKINNNNNFRIFFPPILFLLFLDYQ